MSGSTDPVALRAAAMLVSFREAESGVFVVPESSAEWQAGASAMLVRAGLVVRDSTNRLLLTLEGALAVGAAYREA